LESGLEDSDNNIVDIIDFCEEDYDLYYFEDDFIIFIDSINIYDLINTCIDYGSFCVDFETILIDGTFSNMFYNFYYGDLLYVSVVTLFLKIIFIGLTYGSIFNFISQPYKVYIYEYILFVSILLIICCLIVSTNSWLFFYVLLELFAVIFYLILSFNKYSIIALNTSLKYCIINLIGSVFVLIGIVLFPQFFIKGTFSFFVPGEINGTFIFSCSFLFLLLGLFIKIGLVPGAFWLPDIYAGIDYSIILIYTALSPLLYSFLIIRIVDLSHIVTTGY
jgi:NADH:ubiquinone oxidoreductase subunit 2 (subunit N)